MHPLGMGISVSEQIYLIKELKHYPKATFLYRNNTLHVK